MRDQSKPTIFIIVTRGFVVRNILRSGVLDYLKKGAGKIVIFLYSSRGKEIPDYLRKEFEDGQVILENITESPSGRFHRKWRQIAALLVFNPAYRNVFYIAFNKNTFFLFLEKLFFAPLGRISFLKTAARYIDRTFFPGDLYGEYFEKYRPDVVFSTSILSTQDVQFMKEARRRGIKTASMPRVWDNITTKLFLFVPDTLIVQNGEMAEAALASQHMKGARIVVTGFPQFDWYRRGDCIMPRSDFFKKIGLDPSRKLILWGSTGAWTKDDGNIPEIIARALENGAIAHPAQMLIRSHFTDAREKRFDMWKGNPRIAVDESFSFSEYFHDKCDPDTREITHFINTIYYADVMVTLCSTLTLDGFCFDKPVINTTFRSKYDKKGRDVSAVLYTHDHYQPILREKAVDLANSGEELIACINKNLAHPKRKHAARQRVLDILCYKVDGKSSARVAEAILETYGRN
ncbi:CDP-glycerol glycerophosphotransferase family protein [bacterium]|nr:CDP-glycerol glycerophosphotransferase family protein [bacterium]